MKTFLKFTFIAATAAFVLASCVKEQPDPRLNPDGTPVQFTLTGDEELDDAAANVKVTANSPVTADITVTLSLDAASTIKAENITLPSLVIAKGETEASGKVQLDPSSLAPAKTFDIVIKATVSGVDLSQKLSYSYTTPPAPEKPEEPSEEPSEEPVTLTIDGDPSEWDSLTGNVIELECAEGAKVDGLKSAKVFYDDKLYMLLEITDEAIEATSADDAILRLHIFFNGDNDREGGMAHFWSSPDIDYMLEGNIAKGGEFCKFESRYYKWNGGTPDAWAWSWGAPENTPETECAGDGNFYEMAMDYSTYPGGLADNFTIGFDIADNKNEVLGYLPNAGDDPSIKPIVTKEGAIPAEEPAELTQAIDGDFSEWDEIPAIEGTGLIKEMKVTMTDDKVFFYIAADKASIISDNLAFAHYMTLCLDDGDWEGDKSTSLWNDATYDKYYQFWLMQNGKPDMILFGVDSFDHKEAEDGDLVKFEFSIDRSEHAVFGGPTLLVGAYVNGQTVDTSSGSEVWGGDTSNLGVAPAADKDMAVVGDDPGPRPAPPVASAVTIDGDLSDWDDVDMQVSTQNSRIKEWKITSDDANVYFYFKLRGDRIGGERILYIGFDTDNDAEKGSSIGNVPGVESYAKIQPVTGADPVTLITGVVTDSEVTVIGGDTAVGVVESWTFIGDGDDAYVELSIPRAKLAMPANGSTITVGASYDWYVTGTISYTL